jgi:hypothetical protein
MPRNEGPVRQMTDDGVWLLLREIQKASVRITRLVGEIEDGGHPNAQKIVDSLRDNGFDNAANAEQVGAEYLDVEE